ncbi:DUF5723 family protein [Pontibacter brevis]
MKHFYYKTTFVVVLFFINHLLVAQQMPGLSNSNYSGIHGVMVNPAQVADTRYGFYITLGGFNFTGNSSVFGDFNTDGVTYPFRFPYSNQLYESSLRSGGLNSLQEVNLSSEALGPGLMIKLSENNGVALYTRYRNLIRGTNIPAAFGAFYTGDIPQELETSNENLNMLLNANSFSEVGVSFGQTLYQKGNHYVKAGFTYKRLSGIYSSSFQLNDARFDVAEDPVLKAAVMQLSANEYALGYTTPTRTQFSMADLFALNGNVGSGHGFDVGLSYEFRPRVEQYEYMMDGKIRLDNTKNKYKLRASFALLDLGSITYQGNGTYGAGGSISSVLLNQDSFRSIGEEPVAGVSEVLGISDGDLEQTSFTAQLPRRMNVQLDYHIANSFYVNMMLDHSLHQAGAFDMKVPSVLALTPRFEGESFEFATPVSLIEDYKKVAVGAAIKLGPMEFGFSNILALVQPDKYASSSFYLGLRLFDVKKKRKDADNDGVSDRKDLCPDVQGVWEFRGCPDSDLDGVEDKYDECPNLAGNKSMSGCPDADEDGVRDNSDLCPYEKGLARFYGCLDSDGDGVPDYEDECPSLPGLAGYFGCPDTDGDGIPDSDDLCPKVAGQADFKGCPDTDGDGVPDSEDECPTVAGSYRLNGCVDTDGDGVSDNKDNCPEEKGSKLTYGCPDSDDDGVPDKEDQCPAVAGDASNAGCPMFQSGHEDVLLSQKEKQAVKELEKALTFDKQRQLSSNAKASVQSIAEILTKYPEARLLIMYFNKFEGSNSSATDAWGSTSASSDNKKNLSEENAKVLQQAFINQGLFADQVVIEQKWIEDIPDKVDLNQQSMLMLRVIR